MARFKRILLKLSGESLMGKQGYGIDPERLGDYARQIKEVSEMGVQIGIVIGGGNMPCIVNAANEIVNRAFLENRCSFPQMADIIATTMQKVAFSATPDYEVYVNTNAEARRIAAELLR